MNSTPISKIFITSTKEGFKLKEKLVKAFATKNKPFEDIGVNNETDNTDVLDVAIKLNSQLAATPNSRGIFITDYGSDAAMYMNKFKGIRCAFAIDYYTADMCRRHNNANVLALSQGSIGSEVAIQAVEAFLTAPFESEGTEHSKRVAKIGQLVKSRLKYISNCIGERYTRQSLGKTCF